MGSGGGFESGGGGAGDLDGLEDLLGELVGVFVVPGDGEDEHLVVVEDEVGVHAGEIIFVGGSGGEVPAGEIVEFEGEAGGDSGEFGIHAMFGGEGGGAEGDVAG